MIDDRLVNPCALHLDSTGRIVVCGMEAGEGGVPRRGIALARFAREGKRDTAFGEDGVVRLATDVACLPFALLPWAGSYLAAARDAARQQLSLACFPADGGPPRQITLADPGVSFDARAVAIDAAGRLIVAGGAGNAFVVAQQRAEQDLRRTSDELQRDAQQRAEQDLRRTSDQLQRDAQQRSERDQRRTSDERPRDRRQRDEDELRRSADRARAAAMHANARIEEYESRVRAGQAPLDDLERRYRTVLAGMLRDGYSPAAALQLARQGMADVIQTDAGDDGLDNRRHAAAPAPPAPPRLSPPAHPPTPPPSGKPDGHDSRATIEVFLQNEGIDDGDAREEMLNAGLRRNPARFPKALEIFRKEVAALYFERLAEPVLDDLDVLGARRGRGGGIETLVEKVNLVADGEAAGFDVRTEVHVPGGPVRARDGEVKERWIDVAFYRDDKMVRGFQLVKNVEDWAAPRAHDRELDLADEIGKRLPGNPPIELVWTGIQRPRMK